MLSFENTLNGKGCSVLFQQSLITDWSIQAFSSRVSKILSFVAKPRKLICWYNFSQFRPQNLDILRVLHLRWTEQYNIHIQFAVENKNILTKQNWKTVSRKKRDEDFQQQSRLFWLKYSVQARVSRMTLSPIVTMTCQHLTTSAGNLSPEARILTPKLQ